MQQMYAQLSLSTYLILIKVNKIFFDNGLFEKCPCHNVTSMIYHDLSHANPINKPLQNQSSIMSFISSLCCTKTIQTFTIF